MESIITVLVALILCVVLAFYILYAKRKKTIGKIEDNIAGALNELEALCNPDRLFTDDERESFVAKHTPIILSATKYHVQETLTEKIETIGTLQSQNNAIYFQIRNSDNGSQLLLDRIKVLFTTQPTIHLGYLSHYASQSFLKENEDAICEFKRIHCEYKQYFKNESSKELDRILKKFEEYRVKYNHETYIPYELNENSEYFDTILPYPLDRQQRVAIVTNEDNTLVISSAGSGKTSTIIGKVRYLLDLCKVDPTRLLVVTYTKKAATELSERLENNEVECCTFHSLAYKILSVMEGKKPSICENSILLNVFNDLMKNNKGFLEAVLHYILHLQSLMKLEHFYNKAPEYFADRKKYGIQAVYLDFRGHIIYTKSEEEKRICTYLTELGVNFLYEEPYEYATYTQEHHQYKPDFSIFVDEDLVDKLTGQRKHLIRRVYLEHFAIDDNGNVPYWFGDKEPVGGWMVANRKYKDGIEWKKAKHKECGTTLIFTRSADFHSGNILEVLKQQLQKANVPINPVPPKELYSRLVKRSKKIESSCFNLLQQFVMLLKSNCGSIQPLINKARENNDKRTLVILEDIIRPLLSAYESELRRRGEIDFTDAIIQATKYCAQGVWKRYDYILVDEFQDISVDRYNFLQFLRFSSSTKLFCVGDDWQSIYRFAGSDMKLFYKFEEYFGFTEHCKIESTYRFFNPALSVSSEFIQRNKEQVKKNVKSNTHKMPNPAPVGTNEPTFSQCIDGKYITFLASDESRVAKWMADNHTYIDFHDCGDSKKSETMLRAVKSIVSTIPIDETVLLIGRYNFDVRSLGCDVSAAGYDFRDESTTINIQGRSIRFMSIHSAKGLEADHVILVNCNGGLYGFPSLVEDDPILGYVLSAEDQYENAEERRLFYVAITRAKKHTYVLYNSDRPSSFVRELTSVKETEEMICPVCQNGKVITLKKGVSKIGQVYTNYGCSNVNAGCEYFERVFGNDTPRYVIFNRNRRISCG